MNPEGPADSTAWRNTMRGTLTCTIYSCLEQQGSTSIWMQLHGDVASSSMPVTVVFLFTLEFLLGLKVIPCLFNYFGYRDALRWTKRQQFTKGRFRFLSGGHEFRYYTVTFFAVTVIVGVGLAQLMEEEATLLVRNLDYSRRSDWDITKAARRCKAIDPKLIDGYRSIELYRMPVLYWKNEKLLSKRTENSRIIGQWLMSCTGNRLGETISATGADPVVEVELRCCVVCEEYRRYMKLRGWFVTKSPDGTQIMREICSPRNDDLHTAAFEKLKQINGSVNDIYIHAYDILIPSMLWTYANRTESREYVYHEVGGSEIGRSSLCALLFLAPVLMFVLDSVRRGTWIYHGTREQDVVQYWATGRAFFRPQHDQMVHKWRIVCRLLGKREFEEIIIGGGGWNVFDRTRLKWRAVTKHAENEDGVGTAPCPVCANMNRSYGDQENLLWRNVQEMD